MSTDISWLEELSKGIFYEPSALELSMNLMPFFVMFCISAYIAHKIINQRKNYVNVIGLQYSSIAIALMIFASLFTIVSISYTVPTQNDPTFFHRYHIEILVFSVLLLAFLPNWLYAKFEKNHTTICLYGINPNHKTEFIKKAITRLGWIDYEINKEYRRHVTYSKYGSTVSIREVIVITSNKKKIYVHGNSIVSAKIVSTDLEKSYIEGTELDAFKEAFIDVFVSTQPYTIRGRIVFWLFIVGAVSSLYLTINNSFLNIGLLCPLIIYMSLTLTMGLLFLYADSFNKPSSEVKR